MPASAVVRSTSDEGCAGKRESEASAALGTAPQTRDVQASGKVKHLRRWVMGIKQKKVKNNPATKLNVLLVLVVLQLAPQRWPLLSPAPQRWPLLSPRSHRRRSRDRDVQLRACGGVSVGADVGGAQTQLLVRLSLTVTA
eukprot:831982-Rhodomonas_salina.1